MRCLLWLFMVAFAGSSVSAIRYADNPAIAAGDRHQLPQFLPIGQIERLEDAMKREPGTQADVRASAFNISPCLFVTNSHVVYGSFMGPFPGRNFDIVYSAGIKPDSQLFAGFTKDTVDIAPHERDENGRGDFAVLKSSACVGKITGWFEPADISFRDMVDNKLEVFTVSFPGDRLNGQLEIAFGNIRGYDQASGLIEYSSSTAPGSSGGPVFAILDKEVRLVGIHVGGHRTEGDGYQFLTYSKERTNRFLSTQEIFKDPRVELAIKRDLEINSTDNKAKPLLRKIPDRERSQNAGMIVFKQIDLSIFFINSMQRPGVDCH